MEEIFKIVLDVASVFDGNVVNFVAVILAVVIGLIVAYAVKRLGLNEEVQYLRNIWNLVDDEISRLVIHVAFGVVDLTAYEEEAQRLLETENYSIDPRMLFVVRQVEAFMLRHLRIKPDFVLVHRHAEAVFQRLKHDQNQPNV